MPIENNINIKTDSINAVETSSNTQTIPKTEPYPNDSVELSTKKENTKKSTLKKIGIGLAAAATALVTTVLLFAKHQSNKISKLYKEKLVLSNLAEKIDFKEAKTLEEGIKFAKEVLGIKEVDKNFTLQAINTANRGLVDVSNANKGKLFMPTRLRFEPPKNKDDDYLAYVVQNIESPEFGNLVINKNYFDEKILDKEIKENLFHNGKKVFNIDTEANKIKTIAGARKVSIYPGKDLAVLVDKYYKDSTALSLSEKQNLFYSLTSGFDSALSFKRNPLQGIKDLIKSNKEFLEKNNIKVNIDDIEKMTQEKQMEAFENLVTQMKAKGVSVIKTIELEYPFSTIYHEMGHLQDFAKNLKELDLKGWNFSFKETFKNAKHKAETGEDLSRVKVHEVANRWGRIDEEYIVKLLKEKPEKFKKRYPELYEFVNNQEIQQTAGKVSTYAQSGIGEFIAEVYARLISGKKLSDDVMALYKKYKGPEIQR